jgi:hypothetical protein
MAKSRFDTSFDFGANVAARKATSSGKKKGGKRKLTPAQKYTAALYMQPRRRR